jgi:hypothetical protein
VGVSCGSVDPALEAAQRVVLEVLLEFDPALVGFGELPRFLAPGLSAATVENAVAELRQLGLVHVIASVDRTGGGRLSAVADEFVVVSRTAVRTFQLGFEDEHGDMGSAREDHR